MKDATHKIMKSIFIFICCAPFVAVFLPFILGAAAGIVSGVSSALDNEDVTKWYTQDKAQINIYKRPDAYCDDVIVMCDNLPLLYQLTQITVGMFRIGMHDGSRLWNVAMSFGLVRLVMPFIVGVVITALITRIINES